MSLGSGSQRHVACSLLPPTAITLYGLSLGERKGMVRATEGSNFPNGTLRHILAPHRLQGHFPPPHIPSLPPHTQADTPTQPLLRQISRPGTLWREAKGAIWQVLLGPRGQLRPRRRPAGTVKGPILRLTCRIVPGLQGLPAPLQPLAGLGIQNSNDHFLTLVPSPVHIQSWLCLLGSQTHPSLQLGWPRE